MTREQLRELIASYLEDEMDTIADDENLLYAGLNSMMIMSIVEELRKQGISVNFLDFLEQPTVEGWLEKIQTHSAV
ncbi:phosphopantetheine-binding protein [Neobacillus sedimentimangrovi]|uniref:Phosphopantetheine-binding protein n=1 Tax=Neobacillus sedimentimangrovi TaxID=2699460 RepID=A0ABS8QMB2_9BACI|nr:phosphopantetheine-binding protein [Neobacillus sedimentimangrovi]MCD4839429.1 phosphopantetheine-binding protein [Neobacillus sedimentimangrovi]